MKQAAVYLGHLIRASPPNGSARVQRPVRNDIAGTLGRMQPRCEQYRGGLQDPFGNLQPHANSSRAVRNHQARGWGAHVVVGNAQLLEVAQEVAVQQLELVRSLLHPSAQTRTLEESSLFNSSLSEISSRSLAEVSLQRTQVEEGFGGLSSCYRPVLAMFVG